MTALISSGKDIGYTILPYALDVSLQKELIAHPSDYVLGYITHDESTRERKFIYTESGGFTEVNSHWSLSILKEFPYCEEEGSWIVYSCPPQKTRSAFGKILSNYHQCLHIYNWDIWSVKDKDAKVAVITSWETF